MLTFLLTFPRHLSLGELMCQTHLIGVVLTAGISWHLWGISIFLLIADHVGPMPPLQLSLTESRSREMLSGQISTSHHRCWSHAVLRIMDVREAYHLLPISGSWRTALLMRPVHSTKRRVTPTGLSVLTFWDVETVQSARDAGLLKSMIPTLLRLGELSMAKRTWSKRFSKEDQSPVLYMSTKIF